MQGIPSRETSGTQLCRSFGCNVAAASSVLGSLFCVILMEGRIKELLMPVHEALAAYRGSVVICRALQFAGCGRNLVRQADVAGAAKQGPAPFPFGSASLCCGRRPRSPARSSSFLPPSWSGHHQRASGTSVSPLLDQDLALPVKCRLHVSFAAEDANRGNYAKAGP